MKISSGVNDFVLFLMMDLIGGKGAAKIPTQAGILRTSKLEA